MFENMDRSDQQVIYLGLKSLLETGHYRRIFHNADPGHFVYHEGAEGTHIGLEGDVPDSSPEKNHTFKMLSELSTIFKEDDDIGYVWWYDFKEWQDFCKFVLQENDRRHDEGNS